MKFTEAQLEEAIIKLLEAFRLQLVCQKK